MSDTPRALTVEKLEADVEALCRDCGSHMGGEVAASRVKWVTCQSCRSEDSALLDKLVTGLTTRDGLPFPTLTGRDGRHDPYCTIGHSRDCSCGLYAAQSAAPTPEG